MNTQNLFVVIVTFLLPLLTFANVGVWTPIENPSDPDVVEIAKFAVSEYNKQSKTALKFEKVVKGETQVVSGTNYRLIVSVQNGANTEQYETIVWDKPWIHIRKLLSFKHLLKINEYSNVGIISTINVGGWTPIKNLTDPHVIEIAQFAVSEYNKQLQSKAAFIKFEKVVMGKIQVVSGINYRLEVVVQNGASIDKYEAVVLEKAWIHSMTLISFTPIN